MPFKDMLKTIREEVGLSQSQLAAKAGVSVRSLQNWEIGRNVPRLDAILKLANGLGVEAGRLLEPTAPKPRGRPPKAAEPAAKPTRKRKEK